MWSEIKLLQWSNTFILFYQTCVDCVLQKMCWLFLCHFSLIQDENKLMLKYSQLVTDSVYFVRSKYPKARGLILMCLIALDESESTYHPTSITILTNQICSHKSIGFFQTLLYKVYTKAHQISLVAHFNACKHSHEYVYII